MTRLLAAVPLVLLLAAPTLAQRPASTEATTNDVLEALRPAAGGWTAESAVRRALERSPVVHRAAAVQRQAEAGAGRVGWARWPRLDLTARYTRISEVDQPPFEFAGTSIDNPFPQILDNYAFRASVTVPLTDAFLTIGPSHAGALRVAEAARYQVDAQREALAGQIRTAFYGLVQARGGELVARTSVGLLDTLVRDLRELAAAGVTARADVVRVEAQLAAVRVALARASGAVHATETTLRRLLGLPTDAPLPIGEDLTIVPTFRAPGHEELVSAAMRRRPEAKALRALIAGRQRFVDARRASRWPRLILAANLDVANPNPRIIPGQEELRATWDASAIASWSPNDLAVNDQAVTEAEMELTQARHDLEAFEDGVSIEAAQALSAYEAARQAIGAATEGLAAAGESYRSRRELLAAGTATTTEVLDAENGLARAELDLLQALVGERLARARIQQVVGESALRTGDTE